MKHIFEALSNVQAELKAPKSQYNSFGKYNYRSCEDILAAAKPICIKHGLILTLSDEIIAVNDRVYVKATATVCDIENGDETSTTAFAREASEKKGQDESQITGTASSYARKYALNGLFAIDDTKDADTDAFHKQTTEQTPNTSVPRCSQCGSEIKGTAKASAQEIADWNFKNFGRVLCGKCGKAEAEKRKAQ